MSAFFRETLAIFGRISGIPWLVRNVWARNKVTIIVYHDPQPDVFAAHMEFVARRYNFIALGDLVDALHNRDWSAIPPNALVVTIDDGHRGNYALLSVFKRYAIHPTIYLCAEIAGTLRHFWFRDVSYEQVLQLHDRPHIERLQALERICGYTPQREYSPESRQALSSSEIAEMSPYVDFQAHTCFHPIMTALDDDECRFEIRQSKSRIAELVQRSCKDFCFPNGDYTERELKFVREAGYQSSRTMDMGWNGPDADPFRLKVTGITDDASVSMLAVQLSGIPMWFRHACHGRFDGRHKTLIFEPT